MNANQEWRYLCENVKGIIRAGEICAHFYRANSAKAGTEKFIVEAISELHSNLEKYLDKYKAHLPQESSKCLAKYCPRIRDNMSWQPADMAVNYYKRIIPLLAAFEAEMTYSLSSTEEIMRRATERAFIHLDRSIRANPSIKEDWMRAFSKREEDCEKLGAAHLLLHGIWAFKADAKGERTDLIMGEPPDPDAVASAANALVLTEWKKVEKPEDADNKADEGRKQAELYSQGSLAGIELANYRYIVLVSEKDINNLGRKEEVKDGITYRYIILAVNPDPPSKRSRK